MSHTKKFRRKSRGSVKAFFGFMVGLVLICAAIFLWANKQQVNDWLAYNEYQPTSQVASIADKAGLSETGRFYFYASRPQIEAASEFNKSCERKEPTSAILGCYIGNQIYIYDISDPRLEGIKEVTSVHEMLHAAYQRLSPSEKKKVDSLLEKEYAKVKGNEELASRMAYYEKHESGELYNELHSIVATEFSSIDSTLEAYYGKYFSDRSAITKLHDSYVQVFRDLKKRSGELVLELRALVPQIEASSKEYNLAVKQLNADIKAFNLRATNGVFESQAMFAKERATLVERVNELDVLRSRIDSDIAAYESVRQEYNNITASSNELYKSIDSQLAPAPNV